jgi:uncharacterized protein YndB with AHSA1/START domain
MFNAVATIVIAAPAHKVWEALTNPELIKQYLFGTEVTSDWKIGSPITYRGEWQGKPYEDKGVILNMIPNELLETTYWSNLSGAPDTPENYKKVTYHLVPQDSGTLLVITQDNSPTEEAKNHAQANWFAVLRKLKEILEM